MSAYDRIRKKHKPKLRDFIFMYIILLYYIYEINRLTPQYTCKISRHHFLFKLPRIDRHYNQLPMSDIVNELLTKYKTRAWNYVAESFETFKVNQNPESISALDYAAECITSCDKMCKCPFLTDYQMKHFIEYSKEQQSNYYNYNVPWKNAEVFHFHHGLRFTDFRIKKYIQDKDILDIGGYFGDSACILQEYTKRKVYSYEISQYNFKQLNETVYLNNLQEKVVIIRKGVSNTPSLLFTYDSGDPACSISPKWGENDTLVEMTTIDSEVRERNLNVGFIKADVEGVGLKVLLGGLETIKKHRPVFEIACYHSYEELFGIPQLLRNLPNYFFEFHSENTYDISLGELAIFAFPAEILYDNVVDPNLTFGSFEPQTEDPIGLYA